mmetsp:Transcript_37623/g.116220  ORF Transcript_37623/g.116220 Transcript_37623/m.116220 type:complete len:257 (-) Transcript_37623:1162-1932(-)
MPTTWHPPQRIHGSRSCTMLVAVASASPSLPTIMSAAAEHRPRIVFSFWFAWRAVSRAWSSAVHAPLPRLTRPMPTAAPSDGTASLPWTATKSGSTSASSCMPIATRPRPSAAPCTICSLLLYSRSALRRYSTASLLSLDAEPRPEWIRPSAKSAPASWNGSGPRLLRSGRYGFRIVMAWSTWPRWTRPTEAVAMNLAQLDALPSHCRLSRRKPSMVVPAYMSAEAMMVAVCSTDCLLCGGSTLRVCPSTCTSALH